MEGNMYYIIRLIQAHKLSCPGHLKSKRRFLFFLAIILIAILSLRSTVLSQTIKGTYSLNPDFDAKRLLELLKEPDSVGALKFFFGELYDKELADLLVFIDRVDNKPTHIELLKGGKSRKELWGEKYVYVMVFVAEKKGQKNTVSKKVEEKETSGKITETDKNEVDKPVSKVSESTTIIKQRDPLFVHQSFLDYRKGAGEFFVASMARLAAAIFTKETIKEGEEAKKGEETPDKPMKLQKVGTHADTDLYFGYVKIPIYENTINRITVEEDYGDGEVDRHLATFGNYSASRITSSVGAVGTFIKAGETEPSCFPMEVFAFGHYYLFNKRPKLPSPHDQRGWLCKYWNEMSVSLVAGTNLTLDKGLFKDLFVGVGVGHIVSTAALVAGVNFRAPRNADGSLKSGEREFHWCVGLTFIF